MNLAGAKLTWLGHSTFKLETPGGKTVLIDPWVAGNPSCPEDQKKFKRVDVMLVTHAHFDHIADAIPIARQHNPVVVGIFAAYVAGRALTAESHYLAVFRFVGVTAFLGYSLAGWQQSIWYKKPWSVTLKNTFDGLLYALVTAGTFGWLWPR